MNRKPRLGNPVGNAPCSSHPEAEAGVAIFSPAEHAALRPGQAVKPDESRKAIVSIHGRDVEEIPVTKRDAA